jgi:hypothetical protein
MLHLKECIREVKGRGYVRFSGHNLRVVYSGYFVELQVQVVIV